VKRVVIVGHQGQDGSLLYDLLQKKGYSLIGIEQTSVSGTDTEWDEPVDISDTGAVLRFIGDVKPDELYYLAAFHHSSEDNTPDNIILMKESYKINVASLVNFLDALARTSPKTRLFYAASSHIFGDTDTVFQDESTPINPNCIYGMTKALGLFSCRYYRNNYSLFTSVGILYNHESPLRRGTFVSQKIIKGAVNIKQKKQEKLILGDLSAEIDWGYAPDYVDAMERMLNSHEPDDFIIATGKKHTVRDFVKTTFEYLNLDWKEYIEENKYVIKKKNVCRIGNSAKLKQVTGWQPSVDFDEMIRLLIAAEIKLNG